MCCCTVWTCGNSYRRLEEHKRARRGERTVEVSTSPLDEKSMDMKRYTQWERATLTLEQQRQH